ncbi:MAG: hypothetical protein HOP23_14825, partial [Methylococcaceae bacterium]|nr:hypothetical protein [Methylococcaceae bacterium]
QSSGIQQVNQAIGQMDDVTQQNAALVEQAAASAESLEEQAQQLAISVDKFYVGDKGVRQVAVTRPTPVKVETYQSPKKSASSNTSFQSKENEEWEEF